MYNFHKIRGDKNEFEFEHEKFLKDRPDLLHEIRRKQVESSSSIPSISLIECENNQKYSNIHSQNHPIYGLNQQGISMNRLESLNLIADVV